MSIKTIVLILFGYLLGSIPTSYLAARLLKDIDLRDYGSGTVSGSMLYEHVAKWAVVPVGLFDVFKGFFPTWLGMQLGFSEPISATAGLAAAIGHSWPIFLHFTGGRGLSTFLGILVALFPQGAAWLLGALAIGFFLGDSAPWALLALTALPLAGYLCGVFELSLFLSVSMSVLTILKRLEANRRPIPGKGSDRRSVITYRVFLDRDIQSHRDWIDRKPEQQSTQ